MHSTDSLADAATITDRCFLEESLPIAGPGAPLIAEFSITEFAVAVGLSTEAGKAYLGEAVELRYRLPRVWKRVAAGDLVAWKARWIAKATLSLSMEAAAFVDARVAAFAHRLRVSELDRLVETAIAQFMPDEAERRRKAAADGRSFNVGKSRTGLDGNADVWGTLDVADALDLDAAVAEGAEALKSLGSTESLDVRRAQAARGDRPTRSWRSTSTAPTTKHLHPARKPRQVVLHVHLSEAAIRGDASARAVREHQRPDHRRADPRLVRQPRRPCRREARDRPQRPPPRRRLRGPRPDPRTSSSDQPRPASSPGAPATLDVATPTTSSPTTRVDRRPATTSPRSADDTTGSRPTAAGPTDASSPALSLDQPARLHAPARRVRHPRRQPRPKSLTAPHPAGPRSAGKWHVRVQAFGPRDGRD